MYVSPQALAGDQPTAQTPLRPQQLAPPYTYAPGGPQTWVWPAHLLPACLALGDTWGLASLVSHEALFCHMRKAPHPAQDSLPIAPYSGPLSPPQAPERPLVGVNGLDVTGLRPFDLVIPFTIKKGEITGEWGCEGAWVPQGLGCASRLP